jgi:hypothetical protein
LLGAGAGLDWATGNADVVIGAGVDEEGGEGVEGYGVAGGTLAAMETAGAADSVTLGGAMLEMLVPGRADPDGKPGSVPAPWPLEAIDGKVGVTWGTESPGGVAQEGARLARSPDCGVLLRAK